MSAPMRHGNHVLRDLFAETDASVVTFGYDIGQAVIEDELDLDVGIFWKKPHQGRPEDRIGASAACSPVVIRRVPAGFSRNSLSAASPASISSNSGPTVRSRHSPASVCTTLRVVRVNSRCRSRASSPRIVLLSADCETPSFAAARVKLRRKPPIHRPARRDGRLKYGWRLSVCQLEKLE